MADLPGDGRVLLRTVPSSACRGNKRGKAPSWVSALARSCRVRYSVFERTKIYIPVLSIHVPTS